MNIIFFKENVSYALNKIQQSQHEHCAFWYAQGLTSYRGIETIVELMELHLEESIAEAFAADYPELVTRFPVKRYGKEYQARIGQRKMAFMASNDTMVYLFRSLLRQVPNDQWLLFCKIGENAHHLAQQTGLPSTEVKTSIPQAEQFGLLVMANDWGLLEQKLNYDFIAAGKNTICLQESVIDFRIAAQRMQHCSLPIYQGLATLKNIELKNRIGAVIGNPRYEALTFSPLPADDQVLLNVNFTYGVHEEARQAWVDDIVESCVELDLPYCISQHPRDQGDFSAYHQVRTNAASIHEVLRESSVLVTRFSSLIHEALCLGRPVIYYNPHGESLFYDFEDDGTSLVYARSRTELREALVNLTRARQNGKTLPSIKRYLLRHLGVTTQGQATTYLQELLNDARKYPPLKVPSPFRKTMLALKVAKRKWMQEKF